MHRALFTGQRNALAAIQTLGCLRTHLQQDRHRPHDSRGKLMRVQHALHRFAVHKSGQRRIRSESNLHAIHQRHEINGHMLDLSHFRFLTRLDFTMDK